MRESIMNYIKEEYPKWHEKQKKFIAEYNKRQALEEEKNNEIKELLKDINVKRFAELINYKEDNEKENNIIISKNPLFDFLSLNSQKFPWNESSLEKDNYPIYCFIASHGPIKCDRTGKKLCNYVDEYWDLQHPTYAFGPEDITSIGKRRESFKKKNEHNIIYPLPGESFTNKDFFYQVQTEYVDIALTEGQEKAKEYILNKYKKID